MNLQLDFGGFYETKWDAILDDAMMSDLDYMIENGELEEDATIDDIIDRYDWKASQVELSKSIVDAFNQSLSSEYNFDKGFMFDSLYQPKYYNFENDEINLSIGEDLEEVAKKLYYILVENDMFETYKERYKEAVTPRSGYFPNYTADNMPLPLKVSIMLNIIFERLEDAIYDYVVSNSSYLVEK